MPRSGRSRMSCRWPRFREARIQVDRPDQHDDRNAHGLDQPDDRPHLIARHLLRPARRPARSRPVEPIALDAYGVLGGDHRATGYVRADRRHIRPGPHLQPRLRRLHGWVTTLRVAPVCRHDRRYRTDRIYVSYTHLTPPPTR